MTREALARGVLTCTALLIIRYHIEIDITLIVTSVHPMKNLCMQRLGVKEDLQIDEVRMRL